MKKLLSIFIFALLTTLITAQVSKTVNVINAGTLSTQITENEKTTVTDLTVTGSIDAQDFNFIKNYLPQLKVLDLTNSQIIEYSENPANTVPQFTFNGNTNLNYVKLPSTTTSIGQFAFSRCTELKEITLGNLIISIGDWAFSDCYNLLSIQIPATVSFIGNSPFVRSSCMINVDADNQYYTSIDGVLYNKNISKLISCPTTKYSSNFQIPSSVTEIGENAFQYCKYIEILRIPASVPNITALDLLNCNAFVVVDPTNPHLTSNNYDGGLYNKNLTRLIHYYNSNNAYTFPASVISIDQYAFSYCKNITSITIPTVITLVPNSAFWHCTGLTSVILSPNTTIIDNSSFMGCSSLKSITIPSTVSSIFGSAFDSCISLESIYTFANNPPINYTNVFKNVNKNSCILYVPQGTKGTYYLASGWSEFKNIVEMNTTNTSPLLDENNKINIYSTDGRIIIDGTQKEDIVNILTTNGIQIKSILSKGEKISIPVNRNTIYLVKTGEKIFKVIL